MAAPNIQEIALSLARMLGITTFDPVEDTADPHVVRGDIEDIAQIMTAAYQEIFDSGPTEMRQAPGSGVLNAPTAITLTATNGSTAVSAMLTYASWMAGCTIRIAGDDQDNELLSATLLARPYMGTTGTLKTATVYGDCLTLDETTAKVLSPMFTSGLYQIREVSSREAFLRNGGYFMPSTYHFQVPYYMVGNKPSALYPTVFFVEGYYDSTLDYIQRRIRFSPMPTAQMVIGYTADKNPPRITYDDIQSGDETKVPMPNGWTESIFLPIAHQLLTRLGTFKNDGTKPEIFRQYTKALARLKNSSASVDSAKATYI